VALPDHGLDVVLKKDTTIQGGTIRRGCEKIGDDRVELLSGGELGDFGAHGVRFPPADGYRQRGDQPSGKLHHEAQGSLGGRVMGNGIRPRRVLAGALYAFRLRWVVERNVMDLIALVETSDDFERSDLATASGWVEKVGFHPQQLQTVASHPDEGDSIVLYSILN